MDEADYVICDSTECCPKSLNTDDIKKTEKTKAEAAAEASEKNIMVLNNVYELLKCPSCTTLMSPPIHQCESGHASCSICRTRLQGFCAVCGVMMGSIRCLALEKLAEVLKLPYKRSYKETLLKLAELDIQKE